jgi:hypothetical protein
MIATERLFVTADRRRVVKEDDAAAAFLLCAKGAEIPKHYLPLLQAAVTPEPVDSGSPVNLMNKETALPKMRRR